MFNLVSEYVCNIVESYPIARISSGILLILNLIICFGLRKFVDQACETTTTLKQRLKRGWIFAPIPILAWFCVGLSWTSISPNNYVNELAGNGLYNLAAAFRANELDYDTFYATQDTRQVLARLKDMLKDEDEFFTTKDFRNISRSVRPERPEQKLNVIVVVEESLSAEFLGAFGNRSGLTPNLDRLARNRCCSPTFSPRGRGPCAVLRQLRYPCRRFPGARS